MTSAPVRSMDAFEEIRAVVNAPVRTDDVRARYDLIKRIVAKYEAGD